MSMTRIPTGLSCLHGLKPPLARSLTRAHSPTGLMNSYYCFTEFIEAEDGDQISIISLSDKCEMSERAPDDDTDSSAHLTDTDRADGKTTTCQSWHSQHKTIISEFVDEPWPKFRLSSLCNELHFLQRCHSSFFLRNSYFLFPLPK